MSGEYSILDQAQASGGDPRVYVTNVVHEYPLVFAGAAALGVVLAIMMIYRWYKDYSGKKTESLSTPTATAWAQERSDYGREGAEAGGAARDATGSAATGQRTATVGGGMGAWSVSDSNCAEANAVETGDDAWIWMDKYIHNGDPAAVAAAEGMAARPQSDSQFSRALAGL